MYFLNLLRDEIGNMYTHGYGEKGHRWLFVPWRDGEGSGPGHQMAHQAFRVQKRECAAPLPPVLIRSRIRENHTQGKSPPNAIG